MDLKTVTVVLFSPTGTTRTIAGMIVKGMGLGPCTTIDLTDPAVLKGTVPDVEGDLVLIAVPVYAMGIPAILRPVLKGLKGRGRPVVLVAVYGNMSDGVALSDLGSLAEAADFRIVGAASFIGEHTFSTPKSPVAAGRPDRGDLGKAEEFGRKVADKLLKSGDVNAASITLLKRGRMRLFFKRKVTFNTARLYAKAPVVNPGLCNHCGLCARLCPVEAIDPDSLKIQVSRCLRCCRCVKSCPRRARELVFRMHLPVPEFLALRGRKQKEPRPYL